MPASNCFVCKNKVQRAEVGLECLVVLAPKCSKMPVKDLERFLSLSSVQKKLWTCDDCGSKKNEIRRKGDSSSTDYVSEIIMSKMDALHARFERVDDATARIEKLENDTEVMGKCLDEHECDIAKLKAANGTLWSTVEDLKLNGAAEPPCDLKATEI